MKTDIRFKEIYIKWLPADIYNKVWRWQYMLRRSIARYFKMKVYAIQKTLNEPYLYTEE